MFGNEVGEVIDNSALRRRFKAALERAGLKSIRFHDLRHTFGTIAEQAFRSYREDELSYVLEGRIGVRIGDAEYEAGPGTYVWKPRDVPHTFWNPGPEPARLIEIIWPAGFEQFFARLGELAQAVPHDEFPRRRAELAREYDHHFLHPEWADDLKVCYGLKLLGEE